MLKFPRGLAIVEGGIFLIQLGCKVITLQGLLFQLCLYFSIKMNIGMLKMQYLIRFFVDTALADASFL